MPDRQMEYHREWECLCGFHDTEHKHVLRFNFCSEAGEVSILVPGAGLGRLAYELARLGYSCQGNEFSMFMLLGSNFTLNQ